MIDPGHAIDLATVLRDLYAGAEQEMLAKVARRLERGIEQPGWAERKQAEVSALHGEMQTVVGRVTSEGADLLPQLLEAAHRHGAAAAATLAGETMSTSISASAVQALAKASATGLQGTHFAILRQAEDAYRSVIAEASGFGVTGTASRREAAGRALQRFADRGVSGFVDSRGRRWDLASYTEMATRSAIAQSYLEGHIGEFAAHGRDLVIVSNSPDECPLCRPWEGKVLSISGADPNRPSLAEARAGGLFHATCTHTVGLYVEGLTRPLTNTADPKGNAERARQREIERNIRRWKRREAAAITPTEQRRATAKRAEWQEEQRKFIEQTGRRRDLGRESIKMPTAKLPTPDPKRVKQWMQQSPASLRKYLDRPDLHPKDRAEISAALAKKTGVKAPAAAKVAKPAPPPAPSKATLQAAARSLPTPPPGGGPERATVEWARQLWGTKTGPFFKGLSKIQTDAISRYSGSDYRLMNRFLRKGTGGSPALSRRIDALQEAIDATPIDRDIIVTRGTTLSAFQRYHPREFIGKDIVEPGFMSTSTKAKESFLGFDHAVRLNITARRGTPALYMEPLTSVKGEQELLFGRGTRMRVNSVVERKVKGKTEYVVDAEILP